MAYLAVLGVIAVLHSAQPLFAARPKNESFMRATAKDPASVAQVHLAYGRMFLHCFLS